MSTSPKHSDVQQARQIILAENLPSVALVQRHMLIGYQAALVLFHALEGDILQPGSPKTGWKLMSERDAK